MRLSPEPDDAGPFATHGEIAAVNLTGRRRHAWARFARDPLTPGVTEAILDDERLAAQFLGDLDAFDRLDELASQFAQMDATFRAALIQAEVDSTLHRFGEAREHLARAVQLGGPSDAIERQSLTIDQACGVAPDRVVAARRKAAAKSGRLEDLVPLGAALADLEQFEAADTIYRRALQSYRDVSPFPLAWVCFQLGLLWGEVASAPDLDLAALWYRRAITYVPGYVTARVHLAEVYAARDRLDDAEALLVPALTSRDPEVRWRLAEVLAAQGRSDEAAARLDAARSGFEALLKIHRLAFADHAAEFYAGSRIDLGRAFELACANAANRPTRRAIDLAHRVAKLA